MSNALRKNCRKPNRSGNIQPIMPPFRRIPRDHPRHCFVGRGNLWKIKSMINFYESRAFLTFVGLSKGFMKAYEPSKTSQEWQGLILWPRLQQRKFILAKKRNQKQNHRKKKNNPTGRITRKNNKKKQSQKKLDRPQFFLLFSCFLCFLVFGFLVCFFVCSVFLMKPHILYAVGLIRLIDRWSCWPSPGFIKLMVSRAHKRCLGLGCNLLQRKPQKARWSMQSYKNDRLASVDCRSSRVSKPISMRQVESDFPWVCS